MKSKKHKQEKKKKKHKKEKHRKKNASSSEESSGEEMEWVEASTSSAPSTNEKTADVATSSVMFRDAKKQELETKDDWLESPFLMATTSQADIRKKKDEEKEKEREKNKILSGFDTPGQTVRELNPYWKDGGTGLPEEEERSSRHAPAPEVRRVGRGVDGGVSWLEKSYQRAVQQANDSGRPVNQVVAERWGSVAEYKRLLAEAKEAASGGGGGGRPRSREQRGPSGPPPGWKKRRGDDDQGSGRDKGRERDRQGDQARDWEGRRDQSDDDRRDSVIKGQSQRRSDDRSREDRRDREDRYPHDKRDRYGGDSGRDPPHRGFRRPRDDDRDSISEMRSRFKRPGDDDDDDDGRERSKKTERLGSYDRGSSHRDRRRDDDDAPKWRKGGFRKPGENDDDSSSYRTSSSSGSSRMYPPPSSSSSASSGGWRKASFKKPDNARSDSPSTSRSSLEAPASNFKRPDDDDGGDADAGRHRSSRHRPSPPPTSFSSSSRRRRRSRSSESDDSEDSRENSDDVQSTGSSSPDSRHGSRGAEKEKEEEEEKERSPSPVKLLSDTEMNKLGAKLVKAEIMGNDAQVQKLKAEIEAARQARIAHKTRLLEKKEVESGQKRSKQVADREEEEVILTRTDRSGQSWPLDERTTAPDSGKRQRKKNIVTHDKGGERERYFADDDHIDLETMVRREKMGSAEDHNRLLNKVASKKLALLDSEFNTLDEMFVSSAAKGESRSKVEERERSKAIAEHKRTMTTLSKCPFCLDGGEMKKHLIVALGLKVYLCVAPTRSISEGQCYIVPMQHAVASTALDEDVWAEIKVFRKGLTKMFEDHEMDVCFLETCMNPKKQRHMCIECVPVPRELGEMAPIYFKKAIQESESEWTQNKKLVDTRQKDVRRSIPRGFPFFSVDFGLDGGFAHVIEDELVFPHYFGKEVIGGLLDVEPRLWRHPPKENFEDQSKRVLQLTQWWKPFDWTQKIEREKS